MLSRKKERNNENMQTFQYVITILSLKASCTNEQFKKIHRLNVFPFFHAQKQKKKKHLNNGMKKTTHFLKVIFFSNFFSGNFVAQMFKKVNGKILFRLYYITKCKKSRAER